MAFAYVLDPTNQYQNLAGVNNVHGFFKVFLANTDDIAVTYKDFNGTLNPERIDIDNNGRAVIIADSARPYRVEMYEPNGALVFTQQPVWTLVSGGGMTMVDIESTDGSVSVQKTSAGGITTYDLSTNPGDDPQFLDWIKCSWYDLVDGAYVPRYANGTMSVGARGVVLSAGMHYHVTATVRANKSGATPFYDNIGVHFSLFDGENTVGVQDFTRIVDHSLGLSQDFQVDADIHVGSIDSQLVVSIDGALEGVSFDLVSLDAHRIYSGVPKVPEGIARQDWVNQNFQKKLTAGQNITIDPTTNTISADAAPQVQADWTEQDTSEPSYIQNKPNLATVATSGDYDDLSNKPNLAAVATSGSYDDLSDKPTIPAAPVQSNWNESDSSSLAYIQNKPNLASVATSGSYDDLSDKPSIPAPQVQSDWSESDNTKADYIKNKPNLATVATSGSYDDLSDKPTIPVVKTLVAGQNVTLDETATTITINAEGGGGPVIQEQANWTETNPQEASYIRNKPNLATVATSGDYDDLSNKPTIPAAQVQSDWSQSDNTQVDYIKNKPNLATVATSGSYDDLSDKPSIPAAQVQSDWSESDNTKADYIKNKPNLATVATSGDYADLSNKPTIPAAPVQSNWNESDSSSLAYIQNKPNLATVATSGSYDDLSDKPSIPAAQVQSDWAQSNSSSVDYIKNKPNLATVATSGDYDDLSNKPTIPVVPAMKSLVAGTNVSITEDANGVTISASGAPQVQADWTEQDTSSKAYIQNKPSLATVATSGNYSDLNGTPTIPTVDQTYDGTSTNAQSGVAVASALSGKEDSFAVGNGLKMAVDGQGNRTLQEDETTLFNSATAVTSGSFSEAITHFEKIKVYGNRTGSDTTNNLPSYTEVFLRDGVPTSFILTSAVYSDKIYMPVMVYSLSSSAFSLSSGSILNMAATPTVSTSQTNLGVLRVVGVNRISS